MSNNAITHEIVLNANPASVYEAITTQKGLRGWWTDTATTGSKVGEEAEFAFNHKGAVMTFRIDALEPAQRLVWTNVRTVNNAGWKDTVITFNLSKVAGGTKIAFCHEGWKDGSASIAVCTGGWQYFLGSLKSYVETGSGTPAINEGP